MKNMSTKYFAKGAPEMNLLNTRDFLSFFEHIVNGLYAFSLFAFMFLAIYFISSPVGNLTRGIAGLFLLSIIPVCIVSWVCSYRREHPQWLYDLARVVALVFSFICLIVSFASFVRGEMNLFSGFGHAFLGAAGALSVSLSPFFFNFPALEFSLQPDADHEGGVN